MVTEQKSVEWEVQKYYWKLYRKREEAISKEDILEMTSPIKEEELTIEEVSKTMKNTCNKVAPGAGGLTGAFYKKIWCLIKMVVLGAYNW